MLIPNETYAQSTPTLLNPTNTFIQQRIDNSDPEGWLYFKNSSDLKAGDLFSQHKSDAGLSADDVMVLFETEQDDQACTHSRYQQYYKNIKVEGGEFFEHSCGCYVNLMHGKIIEGLNFNAQPTYTEQQSLAAALTFIGATKYAWEDTDWEQELKDDTENPNSSYYPKGSLTLTYSPGASLVTSNYRLTWRFDIKALAPNSHKAVYVNANTGVVLKSLDMGCDNGPAGTLYDGTQIIDTKWYGGIFHGHHHLEADDNGKNIQTRNGTWPTPWSNLSIVYDNDDIWGLDAPTVNVTSAHWAITRSWDFFKDTYGRKGINNKGNGKVRIFANSAVADNAYWDSRVVTDNLDVLEFGTSTGTMFGIPAGINFAAIDAAGHEYTHGITFKEANLVYAGESGALNESFSDIFGFMIERYSRSGAFTWTIGEDLSFVLRDMQTPEAGFFPQPSTYLTDPLWMNTVGCIPAGGANDNCAVHTNSGVQNRWFFLLSQGGTQNGVTVQGIGMDKAAIISYRNLCDFLGANANHPQSRLGAIAAARQLFGDCSNEVIQTTNAWAAVGVGAVFAGNCVALNGDRNVCTETSFFPYIYHAEGLAGSSFTWSFPPSWSGTTSGPGNKDLTITSFGNFNPPGGFPATVTITVTSSLGGSASMVVTIRNTCTQLCGSAGQRSNDEYLLKSDAATVAAQIFPNPAINQINVSCSGGKPQLISVFSIVGENLMENIPSGPSLMLDISALPTGVYFVKIQFESQTITKKFSKSN